MVTFVAIYGLMIIVSIVVLMTFVYADPGRLDQPFDIDEVGPVFLLSLIWPLLCILALVILAGYLVIYAIPRALARLFTNS